MAEITLKEAKEFYNSSNEVKAFLLTKFTKDELEGKIIPTQEEFNKFFEDTILLSIDYSKMHFLPTNENISKIPTSRIELRNSKDEWLFDYDYNQKNPHFWYSSYLGSILNNYFSLPDIDRHRLMKKVAEKYFNLIISTSGTLFEMS
jgi:hypothetical protein